jgi:creatinine amidohydrolase
MNNQEGYSIFAGTMADMTYPEIKRASEKGAAVLWAMGVIEEHGPHLPLGTDVYLPNGVLQRAREILAERDIPAIIVPPFYWGVNQVTGIFPGSFEVRPEVMVELMADVFRSLAKDGFKAVYCLSGHGDIDHNLTVIQGIRRGREDAGLDARMVVPPSMAKRLADAGGDGDREECLLVAEPFGPPPGRFLDVHAGTEETQRIWASCPDLLRRDVAAGLKPTNLEMKDLAEWRKGREHAQRLTPDGYFGDPAAADPEAGRAAQERQAQSVAGAIAGIRGGG